MTPAARVQSAIDILDALTPSAKPADRFLSEWARSHRFAGAKDRQAIFELVYTVLRRRAECAYAFSREDARGLVLAALRLEGAHGLEQVENLFNGAVHSPPCLSAEEREAFREAPCAATAPDWVRGNYPQWLAPYLGESLPHLLREMQALGQRAPLDLRVNRLKGSREGALEMLAKENIAAQGTPLSPDGIRVLGRARITAAAAFVKGLVEVQDEGSQLAALLACARPGQQVVDVCAGGGGKTLALAAIMENRGQIYALDANPRRLRAMPERLKRAGAHNVQITEDFANAVTALRGRADLVVLDAPCSGAGAWRRNPDAKWRLTQEALAHYMAAQDGLLEKGAELTAPGGRLIYITCSLLACENAQRIVAFLEKDARFAPLPAAAIWAEGVGTPLPDFVAGDAPHVFLTPARSATDGFFICVMERRA
ncbi:MAG: RsmB/NOP family class I SAM-dependent RNA methyltransferase [Pseudomonadota bacterium]